MGSISKKYKHIELRMDPKIKIISTYRTQLEKLLATASQEPEVLKPVEIKVVFGAVAGTVNGNIFITCGKFGTALKLPPDTLSKLFEEMGAKTLKYFPKGRVKKGYALLPQEILTDLETLRRLVRESIGFVSDSGQGIGS